VAGGVDLVQWRDKTNSPEILHRLAPSIKSAVGSALWVVNGPPALGKSNGVHLSESRSATDFIANALDGMNKLIGCSVHTVVNAKRAEANGAHYLVAGTIFASQSHPEVEPAGLGFLKEVCQAVTIPVLAIGGVTPGRVKGCIQAGAAGVAVLSPIMRAADPEAMAREFRQALDAAWEERQ